MKLRQNRSLILFLLAQAAGAASDTSQLPVAENTKKPWTVETSVKTRYFVEAFPGGYTTVTQLPARPVMPSPDGSKFAILSRRGELETDSNCFELRIYDTLEVTARVNDGSRAANPIRVLARHSSDNAPAISSLVWAEDSNSLLFQGAGPEESVAQYSWNLADGEVKLLAPTKRDAGGLTPSHLVAWRADRAVYVDLADSPKPIERSVHYPQEVVTPHVLSRLVNAPGEFGISAYYIGATDNIRRKCGLFSTVDGRKKLIVELPSLLPTYGRNPSATSRGAISPDGKTAIVAISTPPEPGWAGYDVDAKQSEFRDKYSATGQPVQQFWTIDLDTGEARRPLDAPTGQRTNMGRASRLLPDVLWSSDSRTAILVNAALPIQEKGAPDTAWVIAYDIGARSYQRIVPLQVGGRILKRVRWAGDGSVLLTEWQVPGGPAKHGAVEGKQEQGHSELVGYERSGDSWRQLQGLPKESARPPSLLTWQQPRSQSELQSERTDEDKDEIPDGCSWYSYLPPQPLTFSNGLQLTLEEGPDNPQSIVAAIGNRSLVLIGSDSNLDEVRIAPSRTVSWGTPDGKTHKGLLTLPDNPSGAPLPLVIQSYSYMPNVFRPDGHCLAGYAKQALASRGFAVLELSAYDTSHTVEESVQKEIPDTIANVEAAIEALVKDSLVDPKRIGMIGFSRSGFQTRGVLLGMKRFHLRAAVANDSYTGGLDQLYLQEVLLSGSFSATGSLGLRTHSPSAAVHGGTIFENPNRWLAEAPELGANRASGALLNIFHDGTRLEWLFFTVGIEGAFVTAGRPIECMIFRKGVHSLQRPRERYDSLTANVDWMDFWLNGRERAAPSAAAGETSEMLTEKYTRWRKMRVDWERQQAWEAAGHSAGSIPDKDFKVPEKNDGTLREDPIPETTGARKS